MHIGDAALSRGETAAARGAYTDSLAIQRGLESMWEIAHLLNNLGEVTRYEGDYEQAAPLYTESLALFQELDTRGEIARATHNLGYVALARGDGAPPRSLRKALRYSANMGISAASSNAWRDWQVWWPGNLPSAPGWPWGC